MATNNDRDPADPVRDGSVVWKPAVDVNRLARGGQILGGVAIVCATAVLLRRMR